jgi:ubiquitin C-terminal hydrolase
MSEVICKKCGQVHIAFENFCALSLQFPRSSTRITHSNDLLKCFDTYTEPEELDEKEGFVCDRCTKPVSCVKKTTIWRFPRVLVLHLKRFMVSTWRREKLDTEIEFPDNGLDLSKYKGEASMLLFDCAL